MARNTKARFTVAFVLLLLVLHVSSSLLLSEARPLRFVATGSVSGNPVKRGIEASIERLPMEAIKAGGWKSPRGKGQGYFVTIKNSGPSPGGMGHLSEAVTPLGQDSLHYYSFSSLAIDDVLLILLNYMSSWNLDNDLLNRIC
ncbi:hypothetical protein ACJRO7_022440 [Eucalyptus globulus]|uniref:Uncharacterized protein n=1 Tax=Eucalyptus globulus TaxID=34317 RepID=A0ABD3JYE6_EUCGL